MKVWIVSHAYVAPVNHDKLVALAAWPDLDLTVLAPRRWPAAFGPLTVPPAQGHYRVVGARVALGGHVGGYVFCQGLGALRRARPHVLHAELEPWSLAAWQCAMAAASAHLVLFTWENLAGPRHRLARVIERIVLRRAAFVIAGNKAARARMRALGVPGDRLAVLPQFGVAPERYATGDPNRAKTAFGVMPPRSRAVVGYVGRLVPEKGVDVLIRAMDANLEARLLVVGDGPARAGLQQLVADQAGRLEAHFTGAVADADIPHYLAAMDVLVLPSRTTERWAEQFGHVLIEAMAAGVPVVGSASGAIPEVVGDAGLIVAEGDAVSLQRALARVLQDGSLRKDLAQRGRQRVRERYTHAVIAAAQHDIYARLLAA
jgi:glycosyltransferase involved in cell wall biosynthesis